MEYTRFKNGIEADEIKSASFTGVSKAYGRITYLSKGVDYELAAAERAGVVVINMSAASKTLKTNLPLKTSCVVVNAGANAFTLKNVTADTGLSLPAGRAALVVVTGSSGASVITPLYTPAT